MNGLCSPGNKAKNCGDSMKKILVLGCGKKPFVSTDPADVIVKVDILEGIGADVVHDLDSYPYPFADNEFDEIHMDNVLEHLTNVVRCMEELHRIGRHEARIVITVPYFRSIWACLDPTHKHFFTVDTLSYFDTEHRYHHQYAMSPVKFRMCHREFNQNIDKSWFRRLVLLYANKHMNHYETYFSHWYPMEDITYHMQPLKCQ